VGDGAVAAVLGGAAVGACGGGEAVSVSERRFTVEMDGDRPFIKPDGGIAFSAGSLWVECSPTECRITFKGVSRALAEIVSKQVEVPIVDVPSFGTKSYETLRVSLWRGPPTSLMEAVAALPTAASDCFHMTAVLLPEHEIDALIVEHASRGWRPWHMDGRSVFFVRERA
jgi:hypothetical protein